MEKSKLSKDTRTFNSSSMEGLVQARISIAEHEKDIENEKDQRISCQKRMNGSLDKIDKRLWRMEALIFTMFITIILNSLGVI